LAAPNASASNTEARPATALIGLDWGTTSLRAYRIGAAGEVLQTRIVTAGILKLPNGGFPQALACVAGDWARAHPDAVLLASGMVGARQGWVEAPYVELPATLTALARACVEIPVGSQQVLYVVPGVGALGEGVSADVMRGEETQAFGALPESGSAHLVLPGTHSKWLTVIDEALISFATYMTGEVFAMLSTQSILATTMHSNVDDPGAFEDGVKVGFEHGKALLHRLFSVRARVLAGSLPEQSSRAYLSGMLVGAEIADGITTLPADAGIGEGLTVVGEARLTETYLAALRILGIAARAGPTAAAPVGLLRIARAKGLLGRAE
jgi:2-dehydro-3-deoxygalactonokinase